MVDEKKDKKKKNSYDITNTNTKTGKLRDATPKRKISSTAQEIKPETEQPPKVVAEKEPTKALSKREGQIREFITSLKRRSKAAGI